MNRRACLDLALNYSLMVGPVLWATWDMDFVPARLGRFNPTFGQAINAAAYQQPRTFRISMGVRF